MKLEKITYKELKSLWNPIRFKLSLSCQILLYIQSDGLFYPAIPRIRLNFSHYVFGLCLLWSRTSLWHSMPRTYYKGDIINCVKYGSIEMLQAHVGFLDGGKILVNPRNLIGRIIEWYGNHKEKEQYLFFIIFWRLSVIPRKMLAIRNQRQL